MNIHEIPMHGTAISQNNQSIIFIGPRKCGKSSTAYLFVERGWKLISDSNTYIFRKENHFFVATREKEKMFTFTSPSIFPHLNKSEDAFVEFSEMHNEIRLFVDFSRQFSEEPNTGHQIRLFIFPTLSDQNKSQFFVISAAEALEHFKKDVWNLHHQSYTLSDRDEQLLKDMFDRVPCYRLNIGHDWHTFIEKLVDVDHIFNTNIQINR